MIRFVTGTDTGVGKTIACTRMARAEQARGRKVRYVKPIQTGLMPGEAGSDADVVRAAGIEVHELLRFAEPLAPEVAAALEGATIDTDRLVADVRALEEGCDLLIVEGAGGLLVPIAPKYDTADFAAALGGEVVIVARPALGTLNHTALTLEVARARGLTVAGIVVSDWPVVAGITETTNLERLRAMAAVLEVIPHDQ
ncbi:MAG: dethiobiotin synthase [Actinomycetota bacterium]